ncbi:MAG: hypothetical protein MUP45_00310 [Candidatus Marinimicrobia bacterium]|nr:hypothetical protein [Candidatus Neomarinimicrobiota bacterium]
MALPEPLTTSGERKESLISEREKIPLVERKEGEIAPEIRDYVTKVETAAEIKLPTPVTDDQGEIVADDVTPKKVVIELPLSATGIKSGLGHKVLDSFRWLAEWCQRLLKITQGKFFYRGADR